MSAVLDALLARAQAGLPLMVAAALIALGALVAARVARWAVARAARRAELDRRAEEYGVCGRLRISRLLVRGAYWLVLLAGALAALSVFGAARFVEGAMAVLPRLAAAGVVMLVGMWLGLYAGRSVLVWAVNEDLPSPRRLALAVRALVMFTAIVIAAETLQVGAGMFRAVFVIVVAGAVLTVSLAVGLGSREAVQRYLEERERREPAEEESLWNHL